MSGGIADQSQVRSLVSYALGRNRRNTGDDGKYFAGWVVIESMNRDASLVGPGYAAGYARGRHAAREHISVDENPFRRGTDAYHGWNDGHYDERSARRVALDRHSTLLWSGAGE